MLDLIKSALGITGGQDRSAKELNVKLLSSVILLEAAHADHECSEEELNHIIGTIRSMYGLPQEEVDELMEFAHSERGEATDLLQFTRQANERMDREQKLELLEAVWRIIYADGTVDRHEEGFARKLANLLWLEHRDFIDAKLRAKESVKGL
jgi:uncharacterized tellurite resistance protein B-like protein